LATEHLIKLGYERIGYVNGEEGNLLGELRKKGYLRALHRYKKSFNEKFIFRLRLHGEWYDYKSGYEIGEQFSTLSERPDAMFVFNDLSALGFERAILDQGLKVPEDVAIVGFDDIKRGVVAPVPLTTVHQPTNQIGALAVETLKKRIEGGETPVRVLLKPDLIVRKSCGASSRVISGEIEMEPPEAKG
ncbi:MAG: LacI family DNA-binding transcriptional regulator, partial [Fidelibacterota bacterium]